MGIASIVITEPRASSLADFTQFQDVLTPGSPSSWLDGSYKHAIRAMGGFWSAEFHIAPNDAIGILYLEEYLERGLGRHVTAYAESGRVAWEGFINRLVLNYPGARAEVSLTPMANKVWVRYLTSEGGLVKRSTVYQDTASQDRYGIKEAILQGAIMSSATLADQTAEAYLNNYADPRRPRVSVQESRGEGVFLEVFCHGYFRTLNWRSYNQTATAGTQNASAQIDDILTAAAEFIRVWDLESNTSQVDRLNNADELAGDLILNIARTADSSADRFIVGCYEGLALKYEQVKDIDSDIGELKYILRVRDQNPQIKDAIAGRSENPAMIRPNNWLRVEDIYSHSLPPATLNSQNRQIIFIENITFNEPSNYVISSNPAAQIENLLASSGFGGVANI